MKRTRSHNAPGSFFVLPVFLVVVGHHHQAQEEYGQENPDHDSDHYAQHLITTNPVISVNGGIPSDGFPAPADARPPRGEGRAKDCSDSDLFFCEIPALSYLIRPRPQRKPSDMAGIVLYNR